MTRDEKSPQTPAASSEAARPDEPMADLPKEIWTKPLTQREWEVACGLIMHWAMHGGC